VGVVAPQFFTVPILVDIARVVNEVYANQKGKKLRLDKSTLKELVRESLRESKTNVRESWPPYRSLIRRIFEISIHDVETVHALAGRFARNFKVRDGLVRAEEHLNNENYKSVCRTLEKTLEVAEAQSTAKTEWDDLPQVEDFPTKEVTWLIEGLLPAGSVVALSGEEGVGKTLLALSWAKALTTGSNFLGRRVKPTPVLYLGLDVSQVTLQNYIRLMDWDPDGDFRILTMWTGEKQPPMLDDSNGTQDLYHFAATKHPLVLGDRPNGRKRRYTMLRIPRSVLERVHQRCSLFSYSMLI